MISNGENTSAGPAMHATSQQPSPGIRLRGMSADWDDEERAALVALLQVRPHGMTWPQITAQVAETGSAIAVWDGYRPQSLFETAGPEPSGDDALDAAHRDIEKWRQARFTFLTFRDREYPAQLREVHQVPPVLFTLGKLVTDDRAVSVVGSRKASNLALDNARSIAHGLTDAGVTVLSGLAEGVDTAAHEATLDMSGRTVAVVGTGIQKSYPEKNRALQDRIAEQGLVISQFWPDAPPTRQTFPMRNATMSAYGRATIIVEAGEQSGARIQARSAVAHGRPVILMDSVVQGTNWGRKLISAPGVFRAETPQQAVAKALEISSADRLADLLAMVR